MTLSRVPTDVTSLFDSAPYRGRQVEASCPPGPAPSSRPGPGDGMDPYDPERAARLGELIGTLRRRCILMGAPVGLVKMLRVQALLVLYAEQLARRERERKELDRLMRQPPAAA